MAKLDEPPFALLGSPRTRWNFEKSEMGRFFGRGKISAAKPAAAGLTALRVCRISKLAKRGASNYSARPSSGGGSSYVCMVRSFGGKNNVFDKEISSLN
jgi:hypothetical protein